MQDMLAAGTQPTRGKAVSPAAGLQGVQFQVVVQECLSCSEPAQCWEAQQELVAVAVEVNRQGRQKARGRWVV